MRRLYQLLQAGCLAPIVIERPEESPVRRPQIPSRTGESQGGEFGATHLREQVVLTERGRDGDDCIRVCVVHAWESHPAPFPDLPARCPVCEALIEAIPGQRRYALRTREVA